MILLDAYNIIHASRDLSGIADLLGRLAFGRYAGHDITLVVDGSIEPRTPHEQAVVTRLLSGSRSRRVLYAGPHREADDLLEDLLHEAPNPAHITMVSSDRRLRASALRAGATSLDARTFLRHLDEDHARRSRAADTADGPALDRASVAWWLRHFGLADGPPPAFEPGPATAPRDRSSPRSPGGRSGPIPSDGPDIPAAFLPEHPDLTSLDPADLDMEAWLKRHPPPRRPSEG